MQGKRNAIDRGKFRGSARSTAYMSTANTIHADVRPLRSPRTAASPWHELRF